MVTEDDTIHLPEGTITIYRGTHRGGFTFQANDATRLLDRCCADLEWGKVIVEWEIKVQEGGKQ